MTGDKTLTVQSGSTLTIGDGTTLTIPAGSKLVVEDGAKLVLSGTLAVTELENLDCTGVIVLKKGANLLLVDSTNAEASDDTNGAETISLQATAVEVGTENDTDDASADTYMSLPFLSMAGATFYVDSTYSIDSDTEISAKITVLADATLIVNANITMAATGSIENNGTVKFMGESSNGSYTSYKLSKSTTEDSTNTNVTALGITNVENGKVVDVAGNPMVGTPIYDSNVPNDLQGNYYVPYGRTLTVNSEMTLPEGATLRVNGTLVVDEGVKLTIPSTANLIVNGTLTNSGELAIDAGGTLTNNGTLTNESDLTIEAGGTLTNNGTLKNSGKIANDGTLANTLTMTSNGEIVNNGTLDLVSDSEDHPATLELTHDEDATTDETTSGMLTGTGDINVYPNSELTIDPDASLTLETDDSTGAGGTLTSRGTITLADGDDTHTAGTLTIESGATADLAEGSTLDCAGTLTVEKDGTLAVESDKVKLNFDPDDDDELEGNVVNEGTVQLAGSLYDKYEMGEKPFEGTGTIEKYDTSAAIDTNPGNSGNSGNSGDSGNANKAASTGSSGGGDDGGGAVILLAGAAVAVVGGVILAQRMGLFNAKITGVVTDDYGNLLSGATVIMQQYVNGEMTNVQMANTDETGRYKLTKPDGVYVLIAQYVDPTTGKTRTAHVYEDNPTEQSQTDTTLEKNAG
jgi:hypothetical protein